MENKKLSVVLATKTEVEVIDIWMRVQEYRKSWLKRGDISSELITKLDKYSDTLFQLFPEDIRKSVKAAGS